MFINESVFKKLIKKAYKTTGLHIEHTVDGIIAIYGNTWGIEIAKDNMTKKAKAAVIELIGELPGKGESVIYREKQSSQMEVEGTTYRSLTQLWGNAEGEYDKTGLVFWSGIENVIIMQSKSEKVTNHILTYADIVNMINIAKIDADHGEDIPGPGRLDERKELIIWQNNVMSMCVVNRGRQAPGEERLMDALSNIDLRWDFL